MARLDHFEPRRKPFSVHWFLTPEGKKQSYRFPRPEAEQRVDALLEQGFIEILDPFRKNGEGLFYG